MLGLDGSYNGDATAIVAVSTGDQPHVDVEDEIREACQRWRVKAIVADPFRWARSLQLLADDGLPVEDFSQSPAV